LQNFTDRRGENHKIGSFRRTGVRAVQGANGSRPIQYVGAVDAKNADAWNGLLQCEGKGTANKTRSIECNGTWKGVIHQYPALFPARLNPFDTPGFFNDAAEDSNHAVRVERPIIRILNIPEDLLFPHRLTDLPSFMLL